MATTKITTNSLTDASVTSAKLASSISISTLSVTGNLTVDTNTLFVDSVNNRVGVGTVTPSESLTIIGNVNATGYGSFTGNMLVTGNNVASLGYAFIGDTNTGMYQISSDKLGFATGGVNRVAIDATGNVGIGVISPTAKLDVNGTLNVAGNTTLVGTTVATGKVTANGQGALSALVDNDIMTRSLNDQDFCDTNVLRLWDDFMFATDGSGLVGSLGWQFASIIGTGNVRPNNNGAVGFGILGLHTAASRRAQTVLQWDTSNIVGGGGFIPSSTGIENASTVYKTRFKLATLDGGMGAGLAGYGAGAYKYSRFFGVIYVKPADAWTASTAITLNDYRRPIAANGRRYFASIAGTTGGSQPTWPTTAGGTVVDGTVTWTEFGADGHVNLRLMDCPNTTDEAVATFVDTGIPFVADTWYNVIMTYVSVGVWAFSINGVSVGNLTMSATNRSSAFLGTYRVESYVATAANLSIDYFLLFSRGITRP